MSSAHDIMPKRQLVNVLMSKYLPMRGYSSMPWQGAEQEMTGQDGKERRRKGWKGGW